MKGKISIKSVSGFLAVLMIVGMFGACTKGEGDNAQASGSGTVTTTPAKTTVKSASVTVKQTGTASATTKADTSGENQTIQPTPDDNQDNNQQAEGSDSVIEESNDNDYSMDVEIKDILGETKADLGGRTVTLISWGPTTLPLEQYRETNAMFVVWMSKIEAAEKKYNFKLEAKQSALNVTQYTADLTNNTLAGIKIADILYTSGQFAFPLYVSNSLILPLDDYIDYEMPVAKANPLLYKGMLWKGKHYGIRLGWSLGAGCMLFYNQDLIEREGQPFIYDLVQNNQWKWAEMLKIAQYCTKDLNGDGIIDQYGISAVSNWDFIRNILYSNGITGIDFENNRMTYAMDKPQALRAIQFAVEMAFVDKVFIANRTPWAYGNCAMVLSNSLADNKRWIVDYSMKSRIAPLPKGPDIDSYYSIGGVNMYCISALCENPSDIARIWFEACTQWDENMNKIPELIEAEERFTPVSMAWDSSNTLTRYYWNEDDWNVTTWLIGTAYSPDYTLGITGLSTIFNSKMATPIFTGTLSVTAAVDSIKYEVQGLLDQYN